MVLSEVVSPKNRKAWFSHPKERSDAEVFLCFFRGAEEEEDARAREKEAKTPCGQSTVWRNSTARAGALGLYGGGKGLWRKPQAEALFADSNV